MDEPLGSTVYESQSRLLGEYHLLHRLGEGAYGSVYLAQHSRTKEQYAVKEILHNQGDATFQERIRHEAQVMQGLQHPHVTRLYQLLSTEDAFYFVLELASGGELFDKIIHSQRFTERMARKYFQQLISALYYCHSARIAHRDLKAENLLLSADDHLKVCDFGMSTINTAEADEDENQRPAGTVAYMSPELFREDGSFTDPFRTDLYSAGVILYFMLTGELPYDGTDDEEVAHQICFEDYDESLLDDVSSGAKTLIRHLLEKDPKKRADLDDVLKSEWFRRDVDPALFPKGVIKTMIPRSSSSRQFCDFQRKPSGEHVDDVTEAEMCMLRKAFDSIDTDHNGKFITRDELRDCLISLKHGNKVDQSEVDSLAQMFHPADGRGITFEEFRRTWIEEDLAHSAEFQRQFKETFTLSSIAALSHAPATRGQMRTLRNSFDRLDVDHCGVVDDGQLKEMFAKSGISASDDEVRKLVAALSSVNHNDRVTFDEFVLAIAKDSILVRHPLGKRLAIAMDIVPLAESAEFADLATGGTTVVGTIDEVLECLKQNPRLSHEGQVQPGPTPPTGPVPHTISMPVPGVGSSHSFGHSRRGSSLSGSSTPEPGLREEVHTFDYWRNNSAPPSPAMTPDQASLTIHPHDGPSDETILPPAVSMDEPAAAPAPILHTMQVPEVANGTVGRQHSGLTKQPSRTNSGLQRQGFSSLILTPSKRATVGPSCVTDIRLTAASCPGYTHIKIRRISGSTKDFHRAAYHVAQSISSKREQALVDSCAVDDGELM